MQWTSSDSGKFELTDYSNTFYVSASVPVFKIFFKWGVLSLQLAKEVKDLFPFNQDPKKNVLANPLDIHANSSNTDNGKKVYGPKTVFQKGILGNFEPDYKMKHGPGMVHR